MIIKYHKKFNKRFDKLLMKDKKKVITVIEVFMKNPNSKELRNHGLKGNLLGKRAIYAGPDLRIIFEECNGYTLVILLDLGGHNQVYG